MGPSKALWFLAMITQLCIDVSVDVAKNEEKVKARLAISAKISLQAPRLEDKGLILRRA